MMEKKPLPKLKSIISFIDLSGGEGGKAGLQKKSEPT